MPNQPFLRSVGSEVSPTDPQPSGGGIPRGRGLVLHIQYEVHHHPTTVQWAIQEMSTRIDPHTRGGSIA